MTGPMCPDAEAGVKAETSVNVESGVEVENVKQEKIDSTVVTASRAGARTPVTYTMTGREELRRSNPVNSLPMTLGLQPSVVTVNEGGTGLGYSKMTIRGSKGSQVNVTLNGVTLNDAESQEVFWVNIPALGNLINSVQLQRGLGTAATGSGAFGGSVNMSTATVAPKPYVNASFGLGSFNTYTTYGAAGTGRTKSGVYFDVAYSRNYTDGYIHNAKARVQSAMAVLGWMNANNSLKLTYLMGNQHTGITWEGISPEMVQIDRRYNPAGEYYDALGNVRYYDNETDNYTQHHLQLNYTHQWDKVFWTTTVNWTHGFGYYEQYKASKKSSKYKPYFEDPTKQALVDDAWGESFKGDFIINKLMDNDYFVVNSNVKYRGDKLTLIGGVNLSAYKGLHYGDVLWCDKLGDSFDYKNKSLSRWYENTGLKHEYDFSLRAEYAPLDFMTAYAELQYRRVSLGMHGPDDDFEVMNYDNAWNFFNPRAGLCFNWGTGHKAYVSAAYGNREPNRADLKDAIKGVKPGLKPEKMVDVELGYQYSVRSVSVGANLYAMEYWDMLLETGRLNESGYAIKENIDRSWRRGVELSAAWAPYNGLFRLEGNLTLSMNQIKDYTAYVELYDDDWNWELVKQDEEHLGKTQILMSPNVVGMVGFSVTPFKNRMNNSLKTTTLSFNTKFVGKQYWDSTQSEDRMLPAYNVSSLSLEHEFCLGEKGGFLGLGLFMNNLFNQRYCADAWVYRARFQSVHDSGTSKEYMEAGLFPQAPFNAMFKISYRF